MVQEADAAALNTPERRASQRDRLSFAVEGATGRRTGMPALALLYPSPALGAAADPREFAAGEGDGSRTELVAWARKRIDRLLERLPKGVGHDPDPCWYWAAPLILDGPSGDRWENGQLVAEWPRGCRP
jgi:hypothetical protein